MEKTEKKNGSEKEENEIITDQKVKERDRSD